MGTPQEKEWSEGYRLAEKCGYEFLGEEGYSEVFGQRLALMLPNISSNALDLMTKMLCMNPASRITSLQALAHPFFSPDPPKPPSPLMPARL